MSFYNKKEDVIEVQLTAYGKHLLSIGKLKPHSYAFFDDDIIYDGEYAGITEEQNGVQTRILEETPTTEVQTVYTGRETSVGEANESIRNKKATLRSSTVQQTAERHYTLSAPLGTSQYSKEHAPAWKIKTIEGEFSSFITARTGSHPTQNIPLVNVSDSEYKTKKHIGVDDQLDGLSELTSENVLRYNYTNGHIEVNTSDIILEVEEENSSFNKENFTVELFIVETVDTTGRSRTPGLSSDLENSREKLIPLSFLKRESNIKNGILLDDVPGTKEEKGPTSENVEYYLEVITDRSVSEKKICDAKEKERNRDEYYVNQNLPCDTQPKITSSNSVYDSDPEGPFGDDC